MIQAGLHRLQDAFARPLEDFVRESGVRLAVLVNRSGQVLAQQGFDRVLDLVGVASLAAGINASSRALAKQVGEERFEHLYHSGRSRQMFLAHLDARVGQLILVAVFDDRSSIGLVRLFFDEFVRRLDGVPELQPRMPKAEANHGMTADDFERELEASLDRFFQDLVGG